MTKFYLHSDTTVKRRRKELGLMGSRPTTRLLPRSVKEQLVVNEMSKDPAKRHGVSNIKQRIAFYEGTHLTKYNC